VENFAMKQILIAAAGAAILLASVATQTSAAPTMLGAPAVGVAQSDLIQVRGGHGNRGRHMGWGRGRGHHYGWTRGRHRGW
jgi:hypothetical protein